MLPALLLVLLSTACLGAGLLGAAPGARARLSALRRWLRLVRAGERPLRKLSGAEGGTVRLEGTLKADEEQAPVALATAVPPEDADGVPGARAASAAAPGLTLQMLDGTARFEGDSVVVSGSVEIAPGQSAALIKRALGDSTAELCSLAKWHVRCVKKAERVWVTGRLERAPELDGPGGYRSSGSRYRLFAAEGHRSIEVASPMPPRPFVRLRTRVLAGLLGAALGAGLSLAALRAYEPRVATPEPPEDVASVELVRLLQAHHYEQAASLAEGEHDAYAAAYASFLSGRLKPAARMFHAARAKRSTMTPSFRELDSYLAEHAYEDAAQIADKLAAREKTGAEELSCLAEVLRFKAAQSRHERWDYRAPSTASPVPLCALAYADVLGGEAVQSRLAAMMAVLDFGVGKPGYVPDPTAFDADARVAELLLLRYDAHRGSRFEVPESAHILRMPGPYFRMPAPAIDTAPLLGSSEGEARIAVERSVMRAVWLSFLGEHREAARAYGQALLTAKLEAAAPSPRGEPGRCFEIGKITPAAAAALQKAPDAARLFAAGAALSLRAGEPEHAEAYLRLLPADHEASSVQRHLAAMRDTGSAASLLEGAIHPPERALLLAGSSDSPEALEAALKGCEGQGLWLILGPRLHRAAGAAKQWIEGGPPVRCDACGFYGVMGRWADRRAAAQGLGATEEDRLLGTRIGQLRTVLEDRDINVLLYVTGRLAEPEPQ